ncbi:MAG: hypothetical protein QM535_00945 [Limnohabitans sp.]|nr:hypothetical protein [Limnohabitans sp.]
MKGNAVSIAIYAFVIFLFYFILSNIFKFAQIDVNLFQVSFSKVYFLFAFSSLAMLGILFVVGIKNKDNIGYTFMLLTFIKLFGTYFFGKDIVQGPNVILSEKWTYITLFFLFLVFETAFTIYLLSNKDEIED